MALKAESSIDISSLHNDADTLLCGYMRRAETMLDKVIPTEMVALCASYFTTGEQFGRSAATSYTVRAGSRNMITKLTWGMASAFGCVSVPSMYNGIYSWTFEIINYGRRCGSHFGSEICFGITQCAHNKVNGSCFIQSDSHSYCMPMIRETVSLMEWGRFVQMKLSLGHRELSFHSADTLAILGSESTSRGFHENIQRGDDIWYRMAVVMFSEQCTVKLLEYKMLPELIMEWSDEENASDSDPWGF